VSEQRADSSTRADRERPRPLVRVTGAKAGWMQGGSITPVFREHSDLATLFTIRATTRERTFLAHRATGSPFEKQRIVIRGKRRAVRTCRPLAPLPQSSVVAGVGERFTHGNLRTPCGFFRASRARLHVALRLNPASWPNQACSGWLSPGPVRGPGSSRASLSHSEQRHKAGSVRHR
jgi:hypothetical protein